MRKLIEQIMKFGVVGVIAFVIDYGLLALLTDVLALSWLAHRWGEGGCMRKLIEQIMKFGVVGVIAFVIDYGLLALLTEVFSVNYLVSATVSFTVSVVFNYVASMRYVFTHKDGMSRHREFAIFVTLSVIGLLINNFCMWAGVELLGIHYLVKTECPVTASSRYLSPCR